MINFHQTITCPNCGKDSYVPEIQAVFGTGKCTWCRCKFTYEDGKFVVIKKGNE